MGLSARLQRRMSSRRGDCRWHVRVRIITHLRDVESSQRISFWFATTNPQAPMLLLPAGSHLLGHVATLPGLLECTPCGAHAYSDVVGGAVCTDCPPLSQAAGPGSTGREDCYCLPGYILNGTSCDLCPVGAECPGGDEPPRSLSGWCRDADEVAPVYLACCNADDCPGGAPGVCPSSAGTAPRGERTCAQLRLLTMSILVFVLVSVTLFVVGACCWFAGFLKGTRKGARDALKEVVAPFRSDEASTGQDFSIEAFATDADLAADDVKVVDVAEYPLGGEPAPRASAPQLVPGGLPMGTASMQASPVGSAGGLSISSRGMTPIRPPRGIVE